MFLKLNKDFIRWFKFIFIFDIIYFLKILIFNNKIKNIIGLSISFFISVIVFYVVYMMMEKRKTYLRYKNGLMNSDEKRNYERLKKLKKL